MVKDHVFREKERKKKSRPKFKRQESWRYKRLSKSSWRRPKGIDNKMREKRKGWPKSPSKGYRGPKEVRYHHPSGFEEILIHNPKDLEKIDPENTIARIGHTVGAKKRIQILDMAREQGIVIVNPIIPLELMELITTEEEEEEEEEEFEF